MDKDWLKMSACGLGREIESGRIEPRELTERFISAVRDHPHGTSIFARLTESRARAEAEAASKRARLGLRNSILDGVPVSWKDLFDAAGAPAEAGSALLAGRVPRKDAEVLRRAAALGLVCLGKTHLSELAFSGLGLNPVTASPPCVNDPEAVAGGSSSGAAASVAFGLSAAGIGSDTGGSVRLPAAWNDLVGLKTTSGTLPLDGVVPLCSRLDTVGPLTRTVEDAAAVFAALSGKAEIPLLDGEPAEKMRFLIADEGLEDICGQPRKGFETAVGRLRQAGAELVSGPVSAIARVLPLAGCIYGVEAYGQWKKEIEAAPEKMFPRILERFRAGGKYSGAEYVDAWNKLKKIRRGYLAATAGFDAVLLPTSPITPPKKAALLSDPGYYERENLLALRNTRIGNLLGVPALTMPTGVPSAGVMMFGRPRAEERLLRIGAAAERAIGSRQ